MHMNSRLAQYLSTPTESAWETVVHLCDYLRGTTNLCIAAPMYQQDSGPTRPTVPDAELQLAGNYSLILTSQATQNHKTNADRKVESLLYSTPSMVPVLLCWSGAAGVYAAGNATFEFLHFIVWGSKV